MLSQQTIKTVLKPASVKVNLFFSYNNDLVDTIIVPIYTNNEVLDIESEVELWSIVNHYDKYDIYYERI